MSLSEKKTRKYPTAKSLFDEEEEEEEEERMRRK
jgi:hypothetical protein